MQTPHPKAGLVVVIHSIWWVWTFQACQFVVRQPSPKDNTFLKGQQSQWPGTLIALKNNGSPRSKFFNCFFFIGRLTAILNSVNGFFPWPSDIYLLLIFFHPATASWFHPGFWGRKNWVKLRMLLSVVVTCCVTVSSAPIHLCYTSKQQPPRRAAAA